MNKYELYPIPQQVDYIDEQISVSKSITIKTGEGIKKETVTYLAYSLELLGYTVNATEAEETKIILQVEASEEVNQREGYTLEVLNSGSIYIKGYDVEGVHYGVVTLVHLLRQIKEDTLQVLKIVDYPEIMYRGYIEGFYGFPWTHEERKGLMAFTGEQKMNAYIYAPKDDPYHRSHWRELYPEKEAKQITELAETGKANNVHFVWTIHPGDSINLDSEEDFQSTLVKMEQLYDLGVRQFGILFDDIGGWPNGEQQANYINRVDTEFIKAKGDVRPLLTVGTRYCEAWGPSMEKYFKPFVETLHSDVEIMWTGSATMSNVSKKQFEDPMKLIESDKQLSVWWNYPVNDYCDAKMLMGKIENLKQDVNNVNGFFSNPMNQAEASKQALFCIADHNWNTDVFDAEKSFGASFKSIAKEVAKELQIVASNCSYVKEDGGVSGTFFFNESWYMADAIEEVEKSLVSGEKVESSIAELIGHFTELDEAVTTVQTQCNNQALLAELKPFLEASGLMAKAGRNLMLGLLESYNDNIQGMEEKHQEALKQLEMMEACKVLRLKDGAERWFTVDVGVYRIQPFIKEMLKRCAVLAGVESQPMTLAYDMNNLALIEKGVSVIITGEIQKGEEPEKALSGSIRGGKWCSRDFRPSMIIDLQEVKNIKQYRLVNCGHPEAGETPIWNTKAYQVLVSCDGENYEVVDELLDNKADTLNRMLFEAVDARFVKLQIIEPAQISINGGGHTRIYAFEIYDEAYPEQSQKVFPTDIEVVDGTLTISQVIKGDVIKVYNQIDGIQAVYTSTEVVENQKEVIFENIDLAQFEGRIFVERISKNYLPSVKTSKATL